MSVEAAPGLDAGQRAAVAAGKTIVHVCPVAGWLLRPLADAIPPTTGEGLGLLAVTSDRAAADDVAATLDTVHALRPVHTLSGLARTERVLREGGPRTLVGTAADLVALLRRAALKLADVRYVLIGWPETMARLDQSGDLDTLLQEIRSAARLIAVRNETASRDILERHAHRAPLGVAARMPAAPSGAARYAVVPADRRGAAIRAALDQLNPDRAVLWDPLPEAAARWAGTGLPVSGTPDGERATLAIAVTLPTPAVFDALRAHADDVLILVGPHQLPDLQALAAPLRPLHLVSDADRARARAFHLRSRIRTRLEAGDLDAELLALGPLFDDHDPALVAAAAAALTTATAPAAEAPGAEEEFPAWVRLHLSVGRRDQLRPADVVGALLNSVGLAKERVGRVDIRDAFTLVDVRAPDAPAALRGLQGLRLRGRTVAARVDRR